MCIEKLDKCAFCILTDRIPTHICVNRYDLCVGFSRERKNKSIGGIGRKREREAAKSRQKFYAVKAGWRS